MPISFFRSSIAKMRAINALLVCAACACGTFTSAKEQRPHIFNWFGRRKRQTADAHQEQQPQSQINYIWGDRVCDFERILYCNEHLTAHRCICYVPNWLLDEIKASDEPIYTIVSSSKIFPIVGRRVSENAASSLSGATRPRLVGVSDSHHWHWVSGAWGIRHRRRFDVHRRPGILCQHPAGPRLLPPLNFTFGIIKNLNKFKL